MATCRACGAANPNEARFCMTCGTPIAAPGTGTSDVRKVITVLYCDLVGSTELADRLDAEDVDRLLRTYHDIARRRIEAHGGTLEKFIGDGVVGIFGAPAAHEDDPERAVRAALRIVDEVDASGLGVRVRVAVHTGEALVRTGVAPASGQGIAIGDCLNVASRRVCRLLPRPPPSSSASSPMRRRAGSSAGKRSVRSS